MDTYACGGQRIPTSKSDVAPCDHTEGPWQSQHDWDMDGFTTIIGGIDGPDDGRYHYTVICEMNPDARGFEANRRMVIAAPELLETLLSHREWIKRLPIPTEGATAQLMAIDAAISKATKGA